MKNKILGLFVLLLLLTLLIGIICNHFKHEEPIPDPTPEMIRNLEMKYSSDYANTDDYDRDVQEIPDMIDHEVDHGDFDDEEDEEAISVDRR